MDETPVLGRTRNRRSYGGSGKRVPDSVATRVPPSSAGAAPTEDFTSPPPATTQAVAQSVSGISGKTPSNSKTIEPSSNSLEGQESARASASVLNDGTWMIDSSSATEQHHISTGGINPLPKRPACKKSSKKRRRSIESTRLFKKAKKSAPSSGLYGTTASAHGACKVAIEDEAPLRIVNPLLELFEFPISAAPLDISRVPNGAELHAYTELAFHRPDTYPLAYYARVLGFAVPDQPDSDEFVELDPDHVPLLSSVTADPFLQVPPEGKFCALPSKPCHAFGDDDDRRTLDYVDPVYQYMLTNNNDDKVVAAVSPVPPVISNDCIDFGRKCGIITDEWTFEYWKPSPLTPHPDSVLTKWLHDKELLEKLSSPATGHYLILALKNNVPEAWILYQFQWYQLETELNIHKRPMSELILRIHGIENRDTIVTAIPTVEAMDTDNSPNLEIVHNKEELKSVEPGAAESTGEPGDAANRAQRKCAEPGEAAPEALLPPPETGANSKYNNPSVVLMLTALVLEHAHASNVWYALFDSPAANVSVFEMYFRMTRRSLRPENANSDLVSLVCDLKKYSFKYAFLVKKNGLPDSMVVAGNAATDTVHDRLLVRMPTVEEVKTAMSTTASIRSHKRAAKRPTNCFSNADDRQAQVEFGLRVRKLPSDKVQISAINGQGAEVELGNATSPFNHMPSFEILRCFPVATPQKQATEVNEVLSELIEKQKELAGLEWSLEGKVRSVLTHIVQERREFESSTAVLQRSDEKRILEENEKILQRRKEMDMAWQKQLEQDMDAVCDICNDGEVSPDNQILFCEACNVAVHQICYGIEEVPVGDYYCVACRYFKREKMSDIISRMKRDPNAPKFSPSPLPICCELCPRKQGAFIRTDTSKQRPRAGELVVLPKWVHVVCAKWQGLNFVEKNKADVVEDVTELKWTFRRLDIRCALCLGERGAFNPCRAEGCKKNLHVTCARASGLCEVVHGENAKGPVSENPWTLVCPEHSSISPDDIPKDAVTIDQLVRSAKEFPPEPKPEPPPRKPKPFHKLNAKERADYLSDPDFENELFADVFKKLQGVRCEVCDQYEDDGKRLKRCGCGVVFCESCSLQSIDGVGDSREFTCGACKFTVAKTRRGEEFSQPRCYLCCQKGGWLRKAFAAPINKISYYKNNPKEFAKTLFKQQLWAHTLCVFWQYPKLTLNPETGMVDLSDVIMTHGRGFVFSNNRCGLCGGKGGLKVKCAHEGCRGWGEKQKPYQFHVTCARQAGLEVDCQEQDQEYSFFYVKCYQHGGNAYNLRARLEDLIEIEKRRSGMRLERYSLPMGYFQASRLLNGAIWVLKTLGWAWRWAEWWVSHGSSWEPLLEEGQSEENMTKEELRIVDSTPESRCKEARLCRLAALGAALRNRAYDLEDGFDNESLCRALRSLLHAKALVGPLDNYEIDFYVEWLARAYRTKSRLLGFGEDKIHVGAEYFCLHQDDKSPKFELGGRPLPGKEVLPKGRVFETLKDEVDDFFKPERFEDGTLFHSNEKVFSKKPPPLKKPKSARHQDSIEVEEGSLSASNHSLGDKAERSLGGKVSLRVKSIPDRYKQQPSMQSDKPPGRRTERASRKFLADQPMETVPLSEQHEASLPAVDSICETKEVAQVSSRPKRFRRSVLGGDVLSFYVSDFTRVSTPAQSSKRSSEPEVKDVQFTPDEATLPLSKLLSSSKRKESQSKRADDYLDGEGAPSLADALARAEDISKESDAPHEEKPKRKGSDQLDIETPSGQGDSIDEVGEKVPSERFASGLESNTESASAAQPANNSPSTRSRRQGRSNAAVLRDPPSGLPQSQAEP